jgi:hypothetical protein
VSSELSLMMQLMLNLFVGSRNAFKSVIYKVVAESRPFELSFSLIAEKSAWPT